MEKEMVMLSTQSIQFLLKLEYWKNKYYLKEFDSNGKEKQKLTDRQYQILFHIDKNICNTLSDLENTLGLSGSSLSITISKMVREGLLEKKTPKEGEDGRKNYIFLTKKGKIMFKESNERLVHRFNSFFSKMSKAQKKEFRQNIQNIDMLLL